MLLHVRLTVPSGMVAAVRRTLAAHHHCINLTHLPGACLQPAGDLIELDIPREVGHDLLEDLRATGLAQQGGIVISTPTATPFDEADRMDAAAPGDPDDAVLWDEVVEDARDGSRWTVSFQIFLTLATVLASIAVITDSAVLVVGAMVVGPEFAPVVAVCAGIVLRKPDLAVRAGRLLVVSFGVAIVAVTALALIAVAVGLITPEQVTRPRPQTSFIWHPDIWSFIVAVVAGIAGVLAQTTGRATALVGVFISVTTVPAAGNLALGLAVWSTSEMSGAALQLLINLAGLLLAGVLTLVVQRFALRRRGVQAGPHPPHRRARANSLQI